MRVSHPRSVRGSRKPSSVQRRFVAARAVMDRLLHLVPRAGSHQSVAVLSVGGLSYDLKSEEEQVTLNTLYQSLLASITFPVQILWHVVPLSMDNYLAGFVPLPGVAVSEAMGTRDTVDLRVVLAQAHHTHIERLTEQQTLVERRMYLVIPIGSTASSSKTPFAWLMGGKQRLRQREEALQQEAANRCGELIRMLENMRLSIHRLEDQELVRLAARCLCQGRERAYPVPDVIIEAVRQPPAHLADLLAPRSLLVARDHLLVEDEYVRVLVIHHLPRVVTPGWLKPLMDLHEPLEVSWHLVPRRSDEILLRFRRQRMQYQSAQLVAQQKGHTLDPHLPIAASDVEDLITRIASGEEKMLDLSMRILVRAQSKRALNERTERVLAVLHQMLLVARVAHFEQDRAFRSCQPTVRNELQERLLLDTRSASTLFPFVSSALVHPGGIFEGVTPQGTPIILDPWHASMANANRFILGKSGWGKSYSIKTRMSRVVAHYHQQQDARQLPFQWIVIDPDREYARQARALGGQVLRLAPGSVHHLNPFDLPHVDASVRGDHLKDHVHDLHTLLELMLADRNPDGTTGSLRSQEKGVLDRALFETYRRAGITHEVRTHQQPAPLLHDLYVVLKEQGEDATGLAQRLQRYVDGSLSGLFSGPTNVSLERMVIVFDIHDFQTELRPVGLFLVSNFIWTTSFQSRIPRELVVDEASTLYEYESGARFLDDLVRRARKNYLGVTVISQHPGRFQHSSLIANCETQVLLYQDATALELIQQLFRLSSREVQLLRRLAIGEGLLLTSQQRLHVRFVTNELEHRLATTAPRELAERAAEEERESLEEEDKQDDEPTHPRLVVVPKVVKPAPHPANTVDSHEARAPWE